MNITVPFAHTRMFIEYSLVEDLYQNDAIDDSDENGNIACQVSMSHCAQNAKTILIYLTVLSLVIARIFKSEESMK